MCSSLQDAEVCCSPVFDNYEDEEEHISTAKDVDLSSSQPIYDNYESDFDEPFSFPIKEQHHDEINHSMFATDIKYDKFNLPKDLRSSLLFATSHEQKTDIIIEKNIKQEGISSQIKSLLFSELQKPIYEQIHISEGEERLEQQAELTSFYDLVAIYMELCFSEVFSCAIFAIKENYDYKYAMQVEILLHHMKCSLKFICMQRDFVNSSMLSWLHWKHDVT